MGVYGVVRTLLHGLPALARQPLTLWSDRGDDLRRSFYDVGDHEWDVIVAPMTCGLCGRSDSWGWKPVANAIGPVVCGRCVALTYTDRES